jgi:hypothetical protein
MTKKPFFLAVTALVLLVLCLGYRLCCVDGRSSRVTNQIRILPAEPLSFEEPDSCMPDATLDGADGRAGDYGVPERTTVLPSAKSELGTFVIRDSATGAPVCRYLLEIERLVPATAFGPSTL